MNEVLEHIGVPEIIYHDNEGAWTSTQFIALTNSHDITQTLTSTPTPCAEIMIQTLKHMMHQRLEGLEATNDKWVEILPTVLKQI